MKLKFIPVMTLVATMLLSSTVFGATGKVINGRTMIPLRGAFEELGFSVSWDNQTSSATLKDGEHTIVMTQNSKTYYVDGVKYTTDVAPQLVDGSMYIPLRTLGDKIGAKTSWDNTTETATIKYNSNTSIITTGSGTPSTTTTKPVEVTTPNSSYSDIDPDEINSIFSDIALLMDLMDSAVIEGSDFIMYDELQDAYDTFLRLEEGSLLLADIDFTFISDELEEILKSYANNMYNIAINYQKVIDNINEGDSASQEIYLALIDEYLADASTDADALIEFLNNYIN